MAAYAVVQGSSNGNTVSSTSHSITLPSSIIAGEKLVVFFNCNSSVSINTFTGWTKTIDSTVSGIRFSAFTKTAVGSDTLTITTTSTTAGSYVAYRVLTDASFEFISASGTASVNPNPPSLTPTGGSNKYVWFAAAAFDGGTTISSYPTNYNSNQVSDLSIRGVAVATRSTESTTEDPGTYTIGSSSNWVAITASIGAQTPVAGTAPFLTSTSAIFQPAIDFGADATFPIITQTSTIFAPTAYAADLPQWTNESRSSTSWTNETQS